MLEKHIEQYLVKKTRDRGGICLKLACTGIDGVPDRLVFLPGKHFGMVEVKAPGKKLRPLQMSVHRMLEGLGFHTFILDGAEQIDLILDEIERNG